MIPGDLVACLRSHAISELEPGGPGLWALVLSSTMLTGQVFSAGPQMYSQREPASCPLPAPLPASKTVHPPCHLHHLCRGLHGADLEFGGQGRVAKSWSLSR